MSLEERLAELCHGQWSDWMRYMLAKGSFNDNGDWIAPAGYIKAVQSQMNIPYHALSEREKELDRMEALKILAAIEKYERDFE